MDRILVLFLLMLILTQFGKANFGTDYDSVWYGLRPERVLTGPHSIFDSLKLVHFVYYYPKQFEILTLPLAGFNRGIGITAFNVVLLGISFLATYCLGKELELNRTASFLVTALAGSIPAVSNMASTAKSDNLVALYAYLATLFFWRWCKERGVLDLSFAVAAVLGMFSTKITAYAYAPLLVCGFVFAGFRLAKANRRSTDPANISGLPIQNMQQKGIIPYIPAVLALCSYAGLALRTWLLTGVPTMPAFVGIWKIVGFVPKYPWDSSDFGFLGVPIDSPGDFFTHWYRLIFDPEPYGHYAMSWPGNIGFFSICVLLILVAVRSVRKSRQSEFLFACIPLMAGGIVMACLLRRHGDGSTDGNYYAIPVVLTVFSVAGMLSSIKGRIRISMVACMSAFIILHLPVMFVSHWSWHYGTQAFKFSLQKPVFDAEGACETDLKRIGAWGIEEYLRSNPRKRLCVGFSKGEERTLHALSCTHEDYEQIGGNFLPLFVSVDGYKRYLAWAQPDLLIMPKAVSYVPGQIEYAAWMVFQELATNPNIIRIESDNYSALDISAVKSNLPFNSK